MYDNWYERLKEVRKHYKCTQNDLAKLIDGDATAISRYERGDQENISFKFLNKLEKAFTRHEIDYIENGKENSKIIAESYTQSGRGNITGNIGKNSNVNQGHDQIIGGMALDAKETMLIELYREASDEGKKNILKAALAGTL